MKGFNSWISGINRCASLLSITQAPARALEWSDPLQAALDCRLPRTARPSSHISPRPACTLRAPRAPSASHAPHPVLRIPCPRGAPRRFHACAPRRTGRYVRLPIASHMHLRRLHALPLHSALRRGYIWHRERDRKRGLSSTMLRESSRVLDERAAPPRTRGQVVAPISPRAEDKNVA